MHVHRIQSAPSPRRAQPPRSSAQPALRFLGVAEVHKMLIRATSHLKQLDDSTPHPQQATIMAAANAHLVDAVTDPKFFAFLRRSDIFSRRPVELYENGEVKPKSLYGVLHVDGQHQPQLAQNLIRRIRELAMEVYGTKRRFALNRLLNLKLGPGLGLRNPDSRTGK